MTDVGIEAPATDREPMPSEPPEAGVTPPAWLDLIPVIGASLIAGIGGVGLVLAILGAYGLWLTLVLGGAVSVGLIVACRPLLGSWHAPTSHQVAAACALALAVISFVFVAYRPSHHVLINRDPGSYVTTAVWLDRSGELLVDQRDTPFESVPITGEAAVYGEPGPVAYFQFNHLSSVVLAVGWGLLGEGVMFRLPALAMAIGLLALYSATVRATGRVGTSLVAPALFAASLPYIYVARDTYSESFVFLSLWAGLVLLVGLHRRPRVLAGLATGAILGATAATRIDALVYVAVFVPLVALSVATADDPRSRVKPALAVAGGFFTFAALGFVDLTTRSAQYYADLGEQVTLLRLGVIGVVAATAIAFAIARQERVRALFHRHRSRLAAIAATLLGLGLLAGWGLRPELQEVQREQNLLVEGLQAAEGEEIDGRRSYAEFSLVWMSWYLGVAGLAAAIVGMVVSAYRLVRGRATPAAAAVLALVVFAGGIYWFRPSIIPDHPWASRRFVPAVFPGLAAMATVSIGAILGLQFLDRVSRRVAAFGVAALLIVTALAISWPVRETREQFGYFDAVESLCDELGDDAVVVTGPLANRLPMTVRSFCDLPVVYFGTPAPPEQLDELRAAWEAEGRGLVVVALTEDDIRAVASIDAGSIRVAGSAVNTRLAEITLTETPDGYRVETVEFYVADLTG